MPRTKRRFQDDDPTSSSSDGGDDDDDYYHGNAIASTTTTIQRSTYSGGGKQLSRMVRPSGGGKQMRFNPETNDDSEEEDDDDDDGEEGDSEEEEDSEEDSDGEEEEDGGAQNNVVITQHHRGGKMLSRATGGGKQLGEQLNRVGGGKQLGQQISRGGGGKILSMQLSRGGMQTPKTEEEEDEDDEEEDSDGDEEGDGDDDGDEGSEDDNPSPVAYREVGRGGGKFASMQDRLNANRNNDEEEDSDESSEEEEEEEEEAKPIVLGAPSRGGKMFPRPPSPPVPESEENKDNDDMDESEDEDDEEDDDPVQTKQIVRRGGGKTIIAPSKQEDMDMEESDDEESKEEVAEVVEETKFEGDQDMEESSDGDDSDGGVDEGESSESESEGERELDDMEEEELDEQTLVEGDADKKYLDSLPEIERESILASRFEKLKAAQDMKKALRENKRKQREKKGPKNTTTTKSRRGKKKGAAAKTTTAAEEKKNKTTEKKESTDKKDETEAQDNNDENSVPDVSRDAEIANELALNRAAKTRDPVQAKRQAALQKLRDARVNADNKSSNDNNKDELVEDSESDFGTDNSEDEEFKPWMKPNDNKTSTTTQMDESDDDNSVLQSNNRTFAEADLEDFISVTIPRRRLAKWCDEPYFEQAVMNFFVRLAIGRDSRTQKACYRVCKIVGIERKTKYQFTSTPGSRIKKPLKTNKWLRLKFADSTRLFKMIGISDSKPTQDDVTQYLTQLKNRRSDVPSKKEAVKMRKSQDNLVNNYTYTKEDIDKTIAEKKNFSKIISNIGAEKTRVNIAVQASVAAVNEAKNNLQDLEEELLEVDDENRENALTRDVEIAKETLADIEKDLKKKREEQEKVLKAEANRKNRMEKKGKIQDLVKVNQRAKAANKVDVQRQKKNDVEFDPFARRKVKPTILWQVGQDKKKGVGGENSSIKAPVKANSKVVQKKNLIDQGTKAARRDDSDEGVNGDNVNYRDEHLGQKEELIHINELAIDEELLSRNNVSNGGGSSGLVSKYSAARVRRGISLQEYLERKRTL